MTPRCVVLDIDGTVVDARGASHPRLGEVLRAARAAGVRVACATSRGRASARVRLGPLAWIADQGVFDNGAVAVVAGEAVHRRELPPELLAHAVACARSACPRANLAIMHALAPPAFLDPLPAGELHEWGAADRQRLFAEALREPAVKLNAWIPGAGPGAMEPMARALRPLIGEACELVVFDRGAFLSLTARDVCKGSGVRAWLERSGCRPGTMLAAGDDLTDAPLLRLAGTAIAIAGGHADACAAAHRIVGGPPGPELAEAIAAWVAEVV